MQTCLQLLSIALNLIQSTLLPLLSFCNFAQQSWHSKKTFLLNFNSFETDFIIPQDQGNPPQFSDTQVHVNVIDADDQNPKFLDERYSAIVPDQATQVCSMTRFCFFVRCNLLSWIQIISVDNPFKKYSAIGLA